MIRTPGIANSRLIRWLSVIAVLYAIGLADPPDVRAAQSPAILKLGFLMPPNHPEFVVNQLFAKRVQELSQGRAQVQIYHSGVLGDEREMLQQLQVGSLDFARSGAGPLSSISRGYLLADLPFLFLNVDDLLQVVTSDKWKALAEAPLEKRGMKAVGHFWTGVRDLYTKRPVASLKDLKGMKIRTTQGPTPLATWRALGAIPTPISWGELFSSLQTGIVDGAEGSPVTYYANSFYDVAPNLTVIQYIQQYTPLLVSLKTWNSLPPELQKAVLQAGEEATAKCKAVFTEQVDKVYRDVAGKGGKIVHPSDLKEWRERTKAVYEPIAEKLGPEGVKTLEWILSRRQ